MDEYIERETFLRDIEERYCLPCKEAGRDHNGCKCRACWVDDMRGDVIDEPAADVAPMVHGRWIEKWGLYDKGFYISRKVWYECSHCGMKTNYRDECFDKEVDYNYCPNCGSKMDGGED